MNLTKTLFLTILLFLSSLVVNAQLKLPELPVCNNKDILSRNIDTLLLKSTRQINKNSIESLCYLFYADKFATTNLEKATIARQSLKYSSKLYRDANFKEAIYFRSLSARIWFELDSINNYATLLRHLGFDYYRLGDIYNTIKYINLSLELSKKNNQKWNEYLCLYQLAWASWRINNCDEAIKYILLSKKLIDDGSVKNQLSSYYNSISNFYHCNGDIEQALIAIDKAIEISKERKSKDMFGVATTNKVDYLIDNKYDNPKEIIAMIYEVLKINKEMNDKEQLGSNYGLLAKAYNYNKQYNLAIKYALKSKILANEIGDLPRVLSSYDFLKEAYTRKGEFTNALKYSEKYNVLYKKLYGTENSNRIFELQQENAEEISNSLINKLKNEKELSEFKTKQSKKTNWLIGIISLLLIGTIVSYFDRLRKVQKQKTEAQKQQLSHELLQMEMTALRSRMNPHFLFNSLNSIKSFIAQNEPREASNYLSKFATLVRMILDHSKEKTITLDEELKALNYYIDIEKMRLKNKFKCKLDVDKSIHLEGILIPPSILQPFVENSIWHGFANLQEKGILLINVFPKNNTIIIEIEDNGIGRKNAEKFSSKKEKRKSSGTKIIANTVKVYKDENLVDLSVETVDIYDSNKIAKGTKVIITIK